MALPGTSSGSPDLCEITYKVNKILEILQAQVLAKASSCSGTTAPQIATRDPIFTIGYLVLLALMLICGTILILSDRLFTSTYSSQQTLVPCPSSKNTQYVTSVTYKKLPLNNNIVNFELGSQSAKF